ncbi:hypothetical protein N8878_04370 [Psychromonas sp.]|nr:hypothetical protein [Psychromonas sp.]
MLNTLSDEKKMTVIFRMEPGSLGPDGQVYIEEFCEFAQTQLQACAEPYLIWFIVPRFDKSLAEMKFQLVDKVLNKEQATKYLAMFGENYANFEDQLENNLEAIINQFFGR